jgi:hypothetical protein
MLRLFTGVRFLPGVTAVLVLGAALPESAAADPCRLKCSECVCAIRTNVCDCVKCTITCLA